MTCRGEPGREAIEKHQLAALRTLLGAVAAGNPFYGPLLRQAGLDGRVESLEQFFARMPLTRKTAIIEDQRRSPPYGTNLTYPLDRYCRFNQTSATSGAPLRWLDTRESWQWMLDNWKQVLRAAGVRGAGEHVVAGLLTEPRARPEVSAAAGSGDPRPTEAAGSGGPRRTEIDCLYFAFSFGPFLGFWTAFEAAAQMGLRVLPGGGLSSAARLAAMRDNRATVLLCTPSYALRLAEVAAAEGFEASALAVRTIIVAGEPGGSVAAVRDRIERGWPGAAVFDHHGMTEVGPVSYQCPEKPGTLMVLESSYLAEIVEPGPDAAAPVRRGEIGELVLTTLGRLGSPLLRYRTGDLVREDLEVAGKSGRHELALRGGILGRVDDMVVVRGVNVFPSAVDDVLRSIPEVAEYRVEVLTEHQMTEMRLSVEPQPDAAEAEGLAPKIAARMRSAFNLRVPVTVCPVGSLPRFEMKAQRWVRR